MSGTGESTVDFAGEERTFRVRLGEIRRIEQAGGNVGIGEVARRLARGAMVVSRMKTVPAVEALAAGMEFHASDVRETILQGLRGAKMPDGEASALVRREIDDRGLEGLMDHVGTALVVLLAAREAPETSDPGEQTAGAESPVTPPSP